MRLVVKIDDKTYNDIKKGKVYNSIYDIPQESVLAIANGIPIPKDCGRLISMKRLQKFVSAYTEHDAVQLILADREDYLPTIVEEDKE